MFRAALLACLLAGQALAASPGFALSIPSPYGASFNTVPQLICVGPNGSMWLGSGVRLSETLIVTAGHVTSGGSCHAMGVALGKPAQEPGADVSFVQANLPDGFRAIVSCEGIHEGERYLAMGYADGGSPDVEALVGTDLVIHGQSVLRGHVYQGMSGGAVLNQLGAIVAIINAMQAEGKPLAYVTPLSATYLCKAKSA